MAATDSNIFYTLEQSIAARMAEMPNAFDATFVYEGITTNATPTELFLSTVQTAGLTANSVVMQDPPTRFALPPKSLAYMEGTILALRTDTAQGTTHLVATFALSMLHPLTNNAAAAGTNAVIDANSATPTYLATGNPAVRVISGTAADFVVGINSAGYVTMTVTGNASETIAWRIWIERTRVMADPNYIGRNLEG